MVAASPDVVLGMERFEKKETEKERDRERGGRREREQRERRERRKKRRSTFLHPPCSPPMLPAYYYSSSPFVLHSSLLLESPCVAPLDIDVLSTRVDTIDLEEARRSERKRMMMRKKRPSVERTPAETARVHR